MESGEHTKPILVYNKTQAQKLACMQAMCLHAPAHISAKFEWIREIKVSMESGSQTKLLWAHTSPQACKLVRMHLMCLCAQAYISEIGLDRKIKVSMESGVHAVPL